MLNKTRNEQYLLTAVLHFDSYIPTLRYGLNDLTIYWQQSGPLLRLDVALCRKSKKIFLLKAVTAERVGSARENKFQVTYF